VPGGMAVSGTVVQVSHPHRPAKSGQVKVAIEKMVLPSGEIVPLRPSKSTSGKSQSMAAKSEPGDPGLWLLFAPIDPVGWVLLPILPFTKGHEALYPAGIGTRVYFDGPVNLDRAAVLKLQPAPYKGPAEVFFNSVANSYNSYDTLFCGDVTIGSASAPRKLLLNPGKYSFTAWMVAGERDKHGRVYKRGQDANAKNKLKAKPVQLEVQEDHQYWIQQESHGLFAHGLFAKDIQQHQTEFDIVQYAMRNVDSTPVPPENSCSQAARP
jgi:hypothetical protein